MDASQELSQREHDGRRKLLAALAIALFAFLLYVAAYEVTFKGPSLKVVAYCPVAIIDADEFAEYGPNVYALGPLSLPTRLADPLFVPAHWIDAHVPGLRFHSDPPKPLIDLSHVLPAGKPSAK
jgi:hypothetical protein